MWRGSTEGCAAWRCCRPRRRCPPAWAQVALRGTCRRREPVAPRHRRQTTRRRWLARAVGGAGGGPASAGKGPAAGGWCGRGRGRRGTSGGGHGRGQHHKHVVEVATRERELGPQTPPRGVFILARMG